MRQLYLGIDLGTTNSKAAHLDYRNQVSPLPAILSLAQHVDQDRVVRLPYLPSVVMFDKDGKSAFVGEYPRRYFSEFPERTVRSVKRLMGKDWQHAIPGLDVTLSPQAISALILKHIRSQALADRLDTLDDLSSVAISVPASFGGRQREATIEAARLAGFGGTVRLIDEPSAALIHFLVDRRRKGFKFPPGAHFLVFDMGGGTLDVSLARIATSEHRIGLQILARSRYTELAGTEFDIRLTAYLLSQLERNGVTLPDKEADRRAMMRPLLYDLAEPLKINMSRAMSKYFRWNYLTEGEPFEEELFQARVKAMPKTELIAVGSEIFELPQVDVPIDHLLSVLEPFFEPVNEVNNPEGIGTIYGPIHTTLRDAGLTKDDVDFVLMHGGMCELPLVQAGLKNYFPAKTEVTTTPDPMTSVAQGAALYQASKDGRMSEIEVIEPALFESIFIEHGANFDEAVAKTALEGSSGRLRIGFERPAQRFVLRLYHGFSEKDPLLAYDGAFEIRLPEDVDDQQEIWLQWQVEANRTVSFEWATSPDTDTWSPLESNRPVKKTSHSQRPSMEVAHLIRRIETH